MRSIAWAWSASGMASAVRTGSQCLVAAGYGHGGGEHAHGAGELLMRERIAARAAVAGHGEHLYHSAVCVTFYLYG